MERRSALCRLAWTLLDALFSLSLNGIVYAIHGWERLMDTIWRFRCWLQRKLPRPY